MSKNLVLLKKSMEQNLNTASSWSTIMKEVYTRKEKTWV